MRDSAVGNGPCISEMVHFPKTAPGQWERAREYERTREGKGQIAYKIDKLTSHYSGCLYLTKWHNQVSLTFNTHLRNTYFHQLSILAPWCLWSILSSFKSHLSFIMFWQLWAVRWLCGQPLADITFMFMCLYPLHYSHYRITVLLIL